MTLASKLKTNAAENEEVEDSKLTPKNEAKI